MTSRIETRHRPGSYELRVWGRHRSVVRQLARLADSSEHETVEDCYLIVDGGNWNAKIRGESLKIKQLVHERKGFQRWASSRHLSSGTTPSPFDELLNDLGFDDLMADTSIDLAAVIDRAAAHPDVRAVVVTKDRLLHRIGDIRAESTTVVVHETHQRLHTVAIEGDDLTELNALRRRLGIKRADNLAVHDALMAAFDD